MNIVIIGGSGFIGSKLANEMRRLGHKVVAASQTSGLNNKVGEEIIQTLTGAHMVIDVANAPSMNDQAVIDFFEISGHNFLAAEAIAGVKHHITLSVVGIDRMLPSAYFRAKMLQENLVRASNIPYTILQTTQFFELVRHIAQSATLDNKILISDAEVQPVASDDVTTFIAEIASAPPLNTTIQMAGPERLGLDALIRIFLQETSDPRTLITDKEAPYFGLKIDNQSLVPQENAKLGKTKFIDWLRQQSL